MTDACWRSVLMLHWQGAHHDGVCDVFANNSNDSGEGECAKKPQHIHYMRRQLVDFSNDSDTCRLGTLCKLDAFS